MVKPRGELNRNEALSCGFKYPGRSQGRCCGRFMRGEGAGTADSWLHCFPAESMERVAMPDELTMKSFAPMQDFRPAARFRDGFSQSSERRTAMMAAQV